MRFEVYGKENNSLTAPQLKCIKNALGYLEIEIEEIVEIAIHKDEIYVEFEGTVDDPFSSGATETFVYYFDIPNKRLDDGAGSGIGETVFDWSCILNIYDKYGNIGTRFATAMKNDDFETAKELNAKYPNEAYPSLSDSFYVRDLVETGNLEFLKWAKSIDSNINFSNDKHYKNPIEIAIFKGYEDVAIWLIDNYEEVSIFGRSSPLQYIQIAKNAEYNDLVNKMLENSRMVAEINKSGETELFPQDLQDIFVF